MRAAFAALLLAMAAWPLVLMAVGAGSPLRAVRLQLAVEHVARQGFLGLLALAAAALLLWPPFLPGLLLGLHKLKRRLSINRLPTLEAIARLQHFENPADHATAGRGLLAQGLPRQAAPHLMRALELDPTDLRCRFELGQALLQLGSLRDAKTLLEQVVAADPEHGFGDAQLRLADLQLRLRDPERAAMGLERFLARFGKKREALVLLAHACKELGRKEGAAAALREAARPLALEEKRDPQARYWRAKARVARWLWGSR